MRKDGKDRFIKRYASNSIVVCEICKTIIVNHYCDEYDCLSPIYLHNTETTV